MTAQVCGTVPAAVLERIAAAHQVFCCLDYDGTLARIAPTPDAAQPLPGTVEVLQQLARTPGVQVAVVSGRTIADLRRFIDVPDIAYVGIHGLQLCLPNRPITEGAEAVDALRPILPTIKWEIAQALAGRAGILIEDKGLALACHYRLATRADAAYAVEAVERIAQLYTRRGVAVAVLHGHEVVEIRPADVNKGQTVCRLLAAYPEAPLAVYVGDDQTDEDAFVLLPADAITIRVGGPTVRTAARYRVDTPDAVQHFLRAVVASRSAVHPS